LNFTRLIRRVARLYPERDAVLTDDGRMTYRDLWHNIASACQFYLDSGVTIGDRILLVLPNCSEFLQFHFGALKIGAVSVPVRYDYTGREVRQMVANCDPSIVLSTTEWLSRHRERLHLSERTRVASLEQILLRFGPGSDCVVQVNSRSTASINYSYSGGGIAKGAMLTHANHVYAATGHARHHGFLASDRLLIILPMCHVYALSGCVNSGFVRGATLVISKSPTPRGIFAEIERHRVTVLSSVPAMFECLAADCRKDRYDLTSLRRLITGGAYMSAAREREVERALRAEIVQGYGLTECFPIICNPAGAGNRHGTLGIPGRRDISVRIMGRRGQLSPVGVVGEIQIRSKTTMAGYYELPNATKAMFDGEWLRTGDLGAVDEDGYLHFHGMTKPIVNLNGNKVDPLEVRDVLLEHIAVAAVEMTTSQHNLGDLEEETQIHAQVRPKPHRTVTEADLRAFCVARLAAYKVPQIELVECTEPVGVKEAGT